MKAKILLLIGLSLFSLVAFAADASVYKYSRPVIRQDAAGETLLAVPLDKLVYAASQDGFHDLRLIDQSGVETPYLLQKIANRKTVMQRQPSRIETQSLQKTGEDGIVITINLDKDAANADGLSIVTSQHDFEYGLQILGSLDGNDWRPLVEHAEIYDYSRYMAMANRDVALPANNYRFFRIVVAKATHTRSAELLELTRTLRGGEEEQRNEQQVLHQEPLHIERLEVWHNQPQILPETPQQFDYPLAAFKISQDAEHKTSLIDIDSQRLPLTGFKLHIDTANFSRNSEVQIPLKQGIETRMQVIGTALLQAVHFQNIHSERTELAFPEQRREHYRIIIQNQDNPPLEVSAVVGTGTAYQLLFLPQAGKSYRLQYGSDKAAPAVYDTASIQELLGRGYQITAAALGPETAEAPIKTGLSLIAVLDSNVFLGVVIALMVIVLVWCLYKVGKRVGNLPD